MKYDIAYRLRASRPDSATLIEAANEIDQLRAEVSRLQRPLTPLEIAQKHLADRELPERAATTFCGVPVSEFTKDEVVKILEISMERVRVF